jgi:hypothetical protein
MRPSVIGMGNFTLRHAETQRPFFMVLEQVQ